MRLWRENRLDQKWEISHDEAMERFLSWAKDNPSTAPLEQRVRLFFAYGLNSVFDEAEFVVFVDARWEELKGALGAAG